MRITTKTDTAALTALRGAKLIGMLCVPCAHIGLSCVELRTADHFVRLRSLEISESPFDAYSIDVAEGHCEEMDASAYATPEDAHAFASYYEEMNFQVDRLEIFRRDEWQESSDALHPTIGTNPMMQRTDVIGAAPAEVSSVAIICGLALYSVDPSQLPILFYINDYGNLISTMRDNSDIDHYRCGTTSELISAASDTR